MHRMIRNMVNRLTTPHPRAAQRQTARHRLHLRHIASACGVAAAVLFGTSLTRQVHGQGVSLAHYDLQASGFVTPAGMPRVGSPASTVVPAGYHGPGCDTGMCDGMSGMSGMSGMPGMSMMGGMDRMVCGSCGGGGGCSCNSGLLGRGGLLAGLRNGGTPCLFCRGAGCTACRATPFGYAASCMANAVSLLRPFEEAKLCNQRWYDLSIEALVLSRDISTAGPSVLTTLGTGPSGTPVLSLGDIDDGSLESGVRLSAAMIFGPGGNLELTYMGGNEWDDAASVSSPNANLYSFISDFGTLPAGGFDDTDRSVFQSVQNSARFHSAEINYRRRTMFPYCRFQSSWLFGLRYIRYDDTLLYQTRGLNIDTASGNQPTFFNSLTDSENSLFGPQTGFDFWWNVYPGVSLGVGAKAAWMQNDVNRTGLVSANSIPTGATDPNSGLPVVISRGVTADDGDQEATVMGDLEIKGVYRFSYSWSLRASYYLMAIEDIAYSGLDPNLRVPTGSSTLTLPGIQYDDLVLDGFTLGAEYIW